MGSELEQVMFDDQGYMTDPMAWNKEIGQAIAAREGMELSDRHWVVIEIARQYFSQHGTSPTPRNITKDSEITTRELYSLFPKGPAKLVAKIAGLGKPTGCV